MNWLKNNFRLVGLAAVLVLLLAGGIWWLQAAKAKESKARQNYEMWQKRDVDLNKPRPNDPDWVDPTPDNRLVLEKNEKTLKKLVAELADKFGRMGSLPQAIAPQEFTAIAGNRTSRLTNRASQTNTVLPQNFEFGFYYYAKGAFPFQANTPRLQQQLDVVELVANVLMDDGVSSIDQVLLVELPGEETRKQTISVGPPSTPETFAPGSFSIREEKEYRKDEKVYEYSMVPFEFTFHCETEALRKVLNDLLRKPRFFLITSLETITERAPQKPPAAGEGARVYIYGEELLRVRMRFYLVDFKPSGR